MLQKLRERSRGIVGWILLGTIMLVLSLFGFGALNFFVASEPVVAEVGDSEITEPQLAEQVERQRRRLLSALGEEADPAMIDGAALRARVLASLVERAVVLQAAREAGLAVPEEEVERLILATPEFRTDGRFDPDRFRIALAGIGLTPLDYRQALAEDVLVRQVAGGVTETAFVTEAGLERMAALQAQRRDVAWLELQPERFRGEVEVDEEALRQYYADHPERYRQPERVTVRYVRLDRETLAEDIEIDEETLRAEYRSELEQLGEREQRRASHILLTVGDDRSREEAAALARELTDELEAGASFAELAEEYSDDPGSAGQGGDLGFAGRGTYAPAFEEALFALEPGEVSDPVETEFGVHVIRLEEVARTEPASFEERRGMLAERLRERRAQQRFEALRDELETIAYEAPDLTEPAEVLGLEIATAGPFGRAGGEGPFAAPDVAAAAFSEDVLEAGYNSPVLEPEEGVALVLRVAEHQPERREPFDAVAETVAVDYVAERARALARNAAEDVVRRLDEGTSVTLAAAEAGGSWQRLDDARRDAQGPPQPVLQEAFSLPRPGADGRSFGSVELADGAQAVVVVTAVRPGELAALSDAEQEQLRQVLRSRTAAFEFEGLREALRADLGVSIRRGGS